MPGQGSILVDNDSNPRRTSRWSGRFATVAMMFASSACAGCHTWQKSHEAAISHFASGDLETSRTALQKSQQAWSSEKNLLELDRGILELASGDVPHAETRFRTLRRELEHLEQKDVTEQASSLLTDSRAVAFSGRDFERRMILNMALLTSILGDGQDAFAYSLQVSEAASIRRLAIAESMKKSPESNGIAGVPSTAVVASQVTPASFASPMTPQAVAASPLDQPLALSSYLSAAVQSEQPSRYQETEQALNDIGFWNPAFQRHDHASSPAEFGTRCKPGHGTLHVITLVGKAPRWVSESAAPTSAALLIADRIISITGKHTLPPTIAAVKIARPVPSGNVLPVGSVKCVVAPENDSATPAAPLTFATVVDLNEVAEASYREHRDEDIAAVVVRRVLKKGAVYVLKEANSIHRNSLVDLGVNVAGVAWEAMEKPDTRSWRLLPSRIDVARAELPAGAWSTRLQLSRYGAPGSAQTVPVHIADGRNTYVLCIIPEHQFTGHILVGGADNASIPVK